MGRVLIVDDEKSIRTTLKVFLEREGHTVDTAENATVALELFDQCHYDLVFTDIIMPKVSGVELLDSIKARAADIPVIIMTGEPTVDTAVKAVQAGAFDYVSKPMTKATLLKIADQAMHVRELTEHKKRLEAENYKYQENLEAMVNKRTEALEKTTQSIIIVMNAMMELRDPYTAGHQRKVGNLAATIAQEMGLEDRFINGVRVTGYLHDIGKISVPLEILIKPARLTSLEFEIIKEHSNSGQMLLQSLDLPWPVAEMVWQHHERLDGSGYPRGLKKGQILLESRILAVADSVEAMTSHRPYRPSLGLEVALKEIESKKGSGYDADVVDAGLSLFREKDHHIEDQFVQTHFTFE